MVKLRFGAIDIGSNAVRLIINDIIPGEDFKDAKLKKTAYLRLPLRLGGDVFKHGEIRPKKADDFVKAMKIYADLLKFYKVEKFRACATSATRTAANKEHILKRIKDEAGIEIDVIDGKEESLILFETNRYSLPDGKIFLSADLGGGSLQITLFNGQNLIWNHSYKIGTVRILNGVVNPSELDALEAKLKEIKETYGKIRLLGSGGNINKISKIVEEKNVDEKDIKKLHEKLSKMSITERMHEYEFRKDRADVIVPASEIYLKIMKHLDVDKIYVPKIGVADGIIRHLYENHDHSKC